MNSTEIRLWSTDDLSHDRSTWVPFGKIDKIKNTDRWIIITNEAGLEALFMAPKPLQKANMIADAQRLGEEMRRMSMRTRNNLVHNVHGNNEVFIYARKTKSGKIQFKDYTWSKEMSNALAWLYDIKQTENGKQLQKAIEEKRSVFRRDADLRERDLQHGMNKNIEDIQKMNMGLEEIQREAEDLQNKIKKAELERDRYSTSAIDTINQMKKVERFFSQQLMLVAKEIEAEQAEAMTRKIDQWTRSEQRGASVNLSQSAETGVSLHVPEIDKIKDKLPVKAVPGRNDNEAALQDQLKDERIARLEAEAAAANAKVEALETQQRHERMLSAAKERGNRTQADLDQLRENVAAAQVKEKSESQKKFTADLDELQRRKDELINTERSILVRGAHPRNELRLRARIDIQDRQRLKVKIVDHVRDNAFAVEFPDFGRTGVVALGIDSKDENDLFMRTCLSENPNWPKVEKQVTGIGGKRREDVDVAQWFNWHDEIEEKLIATS